METRCFHKKLEFQKLPAKRFLYRSLWAQIFEKKVSNFSKKNEKNNSWADLGPRSAWEKPSQMFVRSGEIPSPGQTWSTKPTTAPWNLNGARPLGAPTHPLVTVFPKRPVIGGGRRPGVWYKHIWVLLCRKQATKNIDPSPMAKNRPFFRFERRALDAAGNFSPPRPRIHLISSRPSSTFVGLAGHEAGWPWVAPMSRPKAYRRVSCFWSACWLFSTWKRKFRRVQQRQQTILEKRTYFSPCSP